jgi:hypothetical protein
MMIGGTSVTTRLLEFLERGAHMPGHGASRDFYGHDRSATFQKRDHQDAHYIEKSVLLFRGFSHVGCDWAHQSVAKQNPEKSADEGSGHFVADFFRRSAESAHRDHNAKNRGHDTKTGKRIGHRTESSGRLRGIVVVDFQVEIEHLVKIKGINSSDSHAQRVTHKIANVMVFQECGIFRKDRTFFGFFDVGLQGHQSFFPRLVEQVIHHFQSVDIGLFAKFTATEDAADSAGNLLDDVEGVGDQQSADGGATDDDQFCGLDQDFQVAAFHEIASNDATEHDYDADNRKHS